MKAYRRGIVLVVVTAMAFALLLVGSASAATSAKCNYNCPPPTAGSSNQTPAAGSSITISGQNWCPGSTVTIWVGNTKVGTATVGANGRFSASITIPAGTPAGTPVTVTGLNSGCQNSVTRQVATVSAATTGGGLPFTGANISRGLFALVALMVAGVLALAVSKRRKPQVAE
jgi:hypothetical protein